VIFIVKDLLLLSLELLSTVVETVKFARDNYIDFSDPEGKLHKPTILLWLACRTRIFQNLYNFTHLPFPKSPHGK